MKELYLDTISSLEEVMGALDLQVPRPSPTSRGWRHDARDRTDILASHLKAMRIVSLLNASLVLLEKGFAQEVYALGRMIDENVEEITFLAIDNPAIAEKQMKWLKEFYVEENKIEDDPLSTMERDRLSRKKVTAAVSNLHMDPHTVSKTVHAIHQLFSGFIHGAYVHLMELFTGTIPRFPMHGISDARYMKVCEENLANHIYRSIGACVIVASRWKKQDLMENLKLLMKEFGEKTDVVAK